MLLRKIKLIITKRKRAHRYVKTLPPYSHCKNCGFELTGTYCSVCGQFAHMDNKPFTESVKFYLEHHYALDHKMGSTLSHLFFRPGFLTREFMNGRIERHVHPFKLYLFSSILLFGIVVGLPGKDKDNSDEKPLIETSSPSQKTLNTIAQFKDSLKKQPNLSKAQEAAITNKIDSLYNLKEMKSNSNAIIITDDKGDETDFSKKLEKSLTKTTKKELMERLLHYLSLSMLILMPILGGLLMLFYRKKEHYYTAHLIHSVHLHVVLFIFIALSSILNYINSSIEVGGWLFLVWLIYFCISLSKFYNERKRKSVIKATIILSTYFFAALFTIAAAALLSIML